MNVYDVLEEYIDLRITNGVGGCLNSYTVQCAHSLRRGLEKRTWRLGILF